jgi:uncharacterized protein (TIGR02996 family)
MKGERRSDENVSEQQDFLRAIIAAPDDDAPRLVYADWLDENGDPERAEFIRLQCELARGDETDPRRERLRSREQQLLRDYQTFWKQQLPELEEVRWEAFGRGFIETVRIESREAFDQQADRIFAAAPVCEARFHRIYQDGAKKLARSPHLARLRVLDLEDGNAIGNVGLEALADSPHLGALTALKLRSNSIGPAGARALARSPHLGPLDDLNLDGNGLYDDGVRALAESPRLRHLTKLSVGWTQCGDGAAGAIAASPHLSGLTWLYLSGNRVTDAGLRVLAASEHLTKLRALYLEANQIGDDGARALAESETLANLVWVYLKSNRLTDAGGRALLRSRHLEHIAELVLVENAIGADVAQELRQRFGPRVWSW